MAKSTNPFRYFDSSPEVIRTVVMMYVKFPLWCFQVNRAKSKAPYPARNRATAAAHTVAASARKRRRVGLLIR